MKTMLSPLAFAATLLIATRTSAAIAFNAQPIAPAETVSLWSSKSFSEGDLPCLPLKRERTFNSSSDTTQDNAYMMMAASYISYSFWPGKRERILTSWGFKEIKIFNSERHSTNGYWAFHDNFVLLALRGTQEPTDLLTDLSVQLESFEIAGTADSRVHAGFLASMLSIYDKLLEAERFAKQKKVPLLIAGHSLGGAIALLGALKLKNDGGGAAAVWTFGLPKVGNNAFYATARKQLGPQWHHINQTIDPIPTLPFSKHDRPTLLKLAANYGDYLPLLNRFAENAGYWEHNGKKTDDTLQKSESVLQQKFTKIARGFWKHLPRSYVCDLADGSLKVN